MNRFPKRPLAAALAFALAASSQQLRAADVEVRTPPGGRVPFQLTTSGTREPPSRSWPLLPCTARTPILPTSCLGSCSG